MIALALLAAPASVTAVSAQTPKHLAPIPAETLALMATRDTTPGAPILMRLYKKESELEVWKQTKSGRYVHLKTFPICRWSGQLGPKLRQGDRQAPEGFYTVAPRQMNPNSSYYLSFDLGYPNAYDRAHGATGSYLMVHGICSSAGCYAMTDAAVGEIYALAREAFAGGQRAFQFQAYPFHMTAENLARYRADPNMPFWRQLKEGSDRFEATGLEPAVGVSGGRYAFAPYRDPAKEALAAARLSEQEARVAALVADGVASVRISYADGGQHPFFAAQARRGVNLGEVSRPEALAFAGRETTIMPARPKPILVAAAAPVQLGARPASPAILPEIASTKPPAASSLVTTFGLPSPAPLTEPLLFGRRLLTSLDEGNAATAEPQPALAGSARMLPSSFKPARFEVAAGF
jgi:murein L,D-transpeptidase YafK